jgi:acyl-CoA synthetase (AMP-forming)/AMP-acid ligase II
VAALNLAMLLEMAADGFGRRVAVGPRGGGIPYWRLRELASAPGPGPGAGEVLALAEPNSVVVPVAMFSAFWAGATYSPLNYRLPDAQVARALERLGPRLLLCPAARQASLAGLAGWAEEGQAWLARRGAAAGPPSPYPEDPAGPAVVLFTSGTATEPKAATLGHDHLVSYVLASTEFASAGEDEAVLLAAPPFHVAGVVGVLTACYAGRRLVPLAAFDPRAWVDTVRAEQVTNAFVVPTMLARIVAVLEEEGQGGPGLPSLRTLTYGGARLPLPVLERALRLLPSTGFVNAYGLTETSSTVSVLGPEDHRRAAASSDPHERARLASAGRPIPGVEVAILGPAGETLPPGQTGEICLRGPQVAGTYLSGEARTDAQGFLHTGDVGFLDAEGYLFVAGRLDDMIIRGGENISPAEVEDALAAHPEVEAAAVVGLPDEEWGEKVAAVVCPRPGTSPDPGRLAGWVAERLGSLKAPEVVAFDSELPVGDTGKVLRRQVRQRLLGLAGAGGGRPG